MILSLKINGTGGGIRTHTANILSVMPPAVGLHQHNNGSSFYFSEDTAKLPVGDTINNQYFIVHDAMYNSLQVYYNPTTYPFRISLRYSMVMVLHTGFEPVTC